MDSQGNPHIAYYDALLADLKYASKTTSIWQVETVDGTGNVGTQASLALDASGMPRIAYYGAYFLRLSGGGRTVALNKIIVAR